MIKKKNIYNKEHYGVRMYLYRYKPLISKVL